MALETAFRRFSLLPSFIHTAALRRASLVQTGNGEPRKAHWLGDKRKQSTTPGQDQKQGGPEDHSPKQPDPRGYRDLASLTLGDVHDAYDFFKSQLLPSPYEAWVNTNYFCMLELVRRRDGRPPVFFGRVKICYPSDGYIHNIQDMELYFPNKNRKPDTVLLRAEDILLDPAKPVQSYCVRVKFCASPEDRTDFDQYENLFLEKGFIPEFTTGYLDLLDMNEHEHATYPWLYVIGSRWLASIPDSVQQEIRTHLREFVNWGHIIFNYHPRRHALRYLSLNEELDFNYGFTQHYLIAPQNTEQTLRKVEESFEEIFMRGNG